ncbi:efflux RND transporter permease subunit [Maribellus maritimus]|uniref:efflux RND transporter permease subunit n=1 Tax=Maribellus maritimus TaxID=2870838 RepID=UPI001EEB77A7|nr:efflux RND transporter permease subunit [Maribellus maritimus]
MKRFEIVESAMRHRQIVFLISALLLILGVYALFVMPRQEFPQFTIRQGLVIGVYPGASSEDVEQQLTTKVEKYLFGYGEIKKEKTYSISKDGMMIVFVTLNDDIKNTDEFWAKLNHGLNTFKAQLPTGVLALLSDNDFGDTSALLITLESDRKTYRELESYLDELENRLRRIKSVSKLRHYGLQKEQISIYIEKEKLTNYGINTATLAGNLFTQGFTTMSGTVDNDQFIAPIHISQSYNSEQDIAEQIIYSDPTGNIIRLKDVARIVREYPDPDSYIANNGHKSLLISMEMQPGNNIVQYGKEVNEVLEQFQSELPGDVSIERIADQPKVVSDSIKTFLIEMLYAIIAVIMVTMVLLPLRVATVAATSIPITIFASLGIMYLTGMELNTVTLAALIVTLGMIVDNSIVIVDSYMEKLDQGMSRWRAAISSAKSFFKAIFSATLAISITFFPFLFTSTGMIKDFVRLFPWTVTITLGISLAVAMLLIPFIQYTFIKQGFEQSKRKKKEGRRNFLDIVQETYEKWLVRAFKHPKITIGTGILSVLLGIVLFTQIPQQLMPIAERNQFAVEIYLPKGNSLEQTALVADSLEIMMKKDDRVKSITSFIGTSSPRFHTTYAPKMPARNYAQFIVNTPSNRATEEILDEYTDFYAEYFPNAHVRFKQLDYQEAANSIEIRISGNNIADLKTAADSLIVKMRTVPELTWVHTNFEEMLAGTHVDINDIEANRLGINKTIVATNLAMRFDGVPLTTLWENDYPVAVKLKAERDHEVSYSDIENEYIHSLIPGVSVPLRQIADVKPDWTQGQIIRRNGVPTISIVSDVKRGVNLNQVFRSVKKIADSQPLPEGTSLSYGGAYETDSEMLPQVTGGLFMSIFIIFLILVFHFRKINLALLVMGSSTLSIIGAVLGVLIMGLNFGVTSILGIVSLIGILVRNGIIMLDYAEELRQHGKKTALEAAFEAGKRRMRPIFLTSMAASMGVIPMIISKSALWAPMGVVIFFGTITSMIFLVLILPVAYWLIFRKVDKNKKKITIAELLNNSKIKPALLTLAVLLGLTPVLSAQNQNNYTLEQCKTLALQNNAQIKNKVLDVESSQQVKKAAYTRYFPQVDATAFAYKFTDPLINMEMQGGNLPVYDGNPANLPLATQFAYFPSVSIPLIEEGVIGMATATQPVYAGKQISTGNKLADLGIEVNQLQLKSTEKEIAFETEKRYWQIVSLGEKMKTLENYTSLLDTLHKEVTDALNAGLITRNDLLKVELKQNELQMKRLKLENGTILAKMAFCQYIGVLYDKNISFVDSTGLTESPELIYTDHQEALVNREEYQLLQKSTSAEKYLTKMQKGEYMPQVAVGVGAMYLDIMDDKGAVNGLAFGTVKIPISGWWEAKYKMKERQFKEEQNRNMVTDNTEKLLLQMQQGRNSLEEAYQQVQLAKISIGQASENLRVTQDSYSAGMVNISDLLDAQAQLQQSTDLYVDALTQFKLAKVNYLQITGR